MPIARRFLPLISMAHSMSAKRTGRLAALLARSPADLYDAIATIAFLDAVADEHSAAPSDLLDAAIAGSVKSEGGGGTAAVVPVPERQVALSNRSSCWGPPAGRATERTILCRSQSGWWTLEVVVGSPRGDPGPGEASLLFTSVHPIT